MSKRRHNFGTKRFKEKSLFIFHARIALKSLILLFVRLIARGARIGKTHTHTHTHRQDKYCNPRLLYYCIIFIELIVLLYIFIELSIYLLSLLYYCIIFIELIVLLYIFIELIVLLYIFIELSIYLLSLLYYCIIFIELIVLLYIFIELIVLLYIFIELIVFLYIYIYTFVVNATKNIFLKIAFFI